MQAPRHIGTDLHRDKFTCCVRLENGRNYLSDWKLEVWYIESLPAR